MSILILGQMAPTNAPCATWSSALNYWRYSGAEVCHDYLNIAGITRASGLGQYIAIAVSGGWWSGSIGSSCSGSDALVIPSTGLTCSCIDPIIKVDVWKALAQGLWSSSTVIYVYATAFDTVAWPTCQGTLCAGPPVACRIIASHVGKISGAAGTNPASTTLVSSADCDASGGPSCTCPTVLAATVTVYDDGTYTIV